MTQQKKEPKYMNRQFLQEEIGMANEHMKSRN